VLTIMRISFFAPLALGLCLLLPACQQAETAKPQLAVVDMARIMRDSEPGKAGVKFLEGIQAEMQTSLNDIQSRLEKNPNDAQAQKELQTVYMGAQQRMQVEQQNVINVLYDMVQRVINGYRVEKGYAVILSSEAAAAYDSKADVTADIVAAVNKQKVDFKPAAAAKPEAGKEDAAPAADAAAQKDAGQKDAAQPDAAPAKK
jgi:outer membrane protein